jgi:hypothetical protein
MFEVVEEDFHQFRMTQEMAKSKITAPPLDVAQGLLIYPRPERRQFSSAVARAGGERSGFEFISLLFAPARCDFRLGAGLASFSFFIIRIFAASQVEADGNAGKVERFA